MLRIDADAHVLETEETWEFMDGADRKYRPEIVGTLNGSGAVDDVLAGGRHATAQVPQRGQGHAAGITRAAGRGGAAPAHGRAQGGHPGHLSHHLHHPADAPARDRAGAMPQLQPLDGRVLETVRQPPALGGDGAAARHGPGVRGSPAGQGERRGGHLHARLRGGAAAKRSPLLSGLRRRQQARHPGVYPLLQRQLRALRLLQVRDRGLLEVQAGSGRGVPHHHHGQDPPSVFRSSRWRSWRWAPSGCPTP